MMFVRQYKIINDGYIDLVKTLLDSFDRTNANYQKVDFAGSGKGNFVNKRSRFHMRNVHILFENPSEFTEFKVACPLRSKKMNEYHKREKQLFDKGETCSDKMGKISKIWKLIENPNQTINANYGYMVYHLRDAGHPQFTNPKNFMSQWEWCQNRLSKNLYTLQAIMHFNRPKDQFIQNLDQPCTVFTQFTVHDGKLNFHSFMRSNDVIYGTPYNLAYFKLLQERMLEYLNNTVCRDNKLQCGYLHHNVTSLHLYENKIDIAKSIVYPKV